MIIRSDTVGSALRRARVAYGMAQEHLAALIQIPAPTLNKVEAGVRSFDTDWLPLMPVVLRAAVKGAIADEAGIDPASLEEYLKARSEIGPVVMTRHRSPDR